MELGLPYIEHPKMSTAIKSHIAYLKKLSINPQWPIAKYVK